MLREASTNSAPVPVKQASQTEESGW